VSELQGAAAELPAENVELATAAEFAAIWNRRSEGERQAWLEAATAMRARGLSCWIGQHEQLQAQLEDAQLRLAAIARLTDDGALYVNPFGVDSRRLRELLYGPTPAVS
jgi:hypothetical protein